MCLVLQHYFDDPDFTNLKQEHSEKDVDQAEYICVKRGLIEGNIKAIKTITGDIKFIISGSTSISDAGELFIKNHS